jgi:hypothetical protein
MGMSAETAIVDYHLPWPTKENRRPFSVSSKQTEVAAFR